MWGLDPLDPAKTPVTKDRGQTLQKLPCPGLPGIPGKKSPTKEEAPLVHHRHKDVPAKGSQGTHPHRGLRKREAVDTVAVGQGDGLEVYHLEQALSPGEL